MKLASRASSTLLAILIGCAFLPDVAKGSISITDFQFTSDSIEFTISGSLPLGPPADNLNILYFANSNFTADPGAILPGSFVVPISLPGWTGTQSFSPDFPLFTVGTNNYDALGWLFESDLSGGEALNGHLSATFPANTFNPAEAEQLDLFWGIGGAGSIQGGVLLTSIQVPETSSSLLLGFAGLAVAFRRRRAG